MHLPIMPVSILDPAVCAACQNDLLWGGGLHARCFCGQISAHLSRAERKIWHQEHRRIGSGEHRSSPPFPTTRPGQRPRLYLVPTGTPSEKSRPGTARTAQVPPPPDHGPDVITVAGFSLATPPRPDRSL